MQSAKVDDRAVVAQAIEAIEKSAMNRDKFDAKSIAAQADGKLAAGEEVQSVLQWVVAQLNDGHSLVLSPAEVARMEGAKAPAIAGARSQLPPPVAPSGKLVKAPQGLEVGYLRVPYFVSTDPEAMVAFTGALVRLQSEMIGQGAKAWIVDLRGNVGGNQWPMLAGLTGILGSGLLGTLIAPDGSRQTWGTSQGEAWAGSPEQVVFGDESFKSQDTSSWAVALLTDQRTASSGEALAISFRGRPRTKSFGDATRGKSSANMLVPLANGAMLALTTSVMVDRTGKTYGGAVQPDVVFGLPAPSRDDQHPSERDGPDIVLTEALKWLSSEVSKKY